jgi:hypothetical protein
LKFKEPVRIEVEKEVPIKVDLSRKVEDFMVKFQKNNQKKVLQQTVFRVLYSNWVMNKMYRKIKSGGGRDLLKK